MPPIDRTLSVGFQCWSRKSCAAPDRRRTAPLQGSLKSIYRCFGGFFFGCCFFCFTSFWFFIASEPEFLQHYRVPCPRNTQGRRTGRLKGISFPQPRRSDIKYWIRMTWNEAMWWWGRWRWRRRKRQKLEERDGARAPESRAAFGVSPRPAASIHPQTEPTAPSLSIQYITVDSSKQGLLSGCCCIILGKYIYFYTSLKWNILFYLFSFFLSLPFRAFKLKWKFHLPMRLVLCASLRFTFVLHFHTGVL